MQVAYAAESLLSRAQMQISIPEYNVKSAAYEVKLPIHLICEADVEEDRGADLRSGRRPRTSSDPTPHSLPLDPRACAHAL
jgi:hypothetical protein